MRDKRAESGGMPIKKLVSIILALVVVVTIFIFIALSDVHGFVKYLPWIGSSGGDPVDTIISGVVYGVPVSLNLNNGEHVCIIQEAHSQNLNEPDASWLLDYGLKGKDLYKKKGGKYVKVDTGIDWIPKYMMDEKKADAELKFLEVKLMEAVRDYYKEVYDGYKKAEKIDGIEALEYHLEQRYVPTYSSPRVAYVEINNLFLKDSSLLNLNYLYGLENYRKLFLEGAKLDELIAENNLDIKLIKVEMRYDSGEKNERYILQSTKDENYAVAGGVLYKFENDEWKLIEDPSYRLMISDPQKFIEQIIRQDLMKECKDWNKKIVPFESPETDYRYLSEFKFDVLLKDYDGRCIVYDSKDDPGFEHYGVKYERKSERRSFGTLLSKKEWRMYELDENGQWEDIEDEYDSLEDEGLRIVNVKYYLEDAEKRFGEELSLYNVEFCYDSKGEDCIAIGVDYIDLTRFEMVKLLRRAKEDGVSNLGTLKKYDVDLKKSVGSVTDKDLFIVYSSSSSSPSFKHSSLDLLLEDLQYKLDISLPSRKVGDKYTYYIQADHFVTAYDTVPILINNGDLYRRSGESVVKLNSNNAPLLYDERADQLFKAGVVSGYLKDFC
ncbi:hypothetical protein GOV14_00815 [Candidatus Pacearchaeota archaeon]|nr:hypothetical protein [Candidatus Pacearchaeota archaeon]